MTVPVVLSGGKLGASRPLTLTFETVAMGKKSAGLLMYRHRHGELEFFLIHPGGPYWHNKDWHAWSIPKGEIDPGEDAFAAAKREFWEETGLTPEGSFQPLTTVKQSGGKVVMAWAFEGDCDPAGVKSNSFSLEWPPRSGQFQNFPEVDRAAWFSLEEAKERIIKAQAAFLEELAVHLQKASSSKD
ncbi:NUDIX domain-containing protein [Pseudanabaena sp. FACHB-2040]|uniref:NUDIX domain-containing protein n=1 Tax=Pseudanabaena sp. FACHB-2040 TaxID=2692859 RepID=UPI001F559921|nr:NUDIX domain-containing protein [Pseudanabaena sp. FACHB-2040]